ncbi:H-NS histone family protein [Paucibacter sp. M5-1]|uniref:H-NS histone family protein n=1 Tax=Paucibacter sp. M5-1 TaxID=3015998 RepID=UPI0022B93631|nr:H-NS histone family protein [Paucibacter sp. M5-1]MCZ7879499.1 H-NS histone family protein [Paucibacter sp. M5-1]
MAKPFSRILDQIERLQKEAAAIQTGVVDRIRKEIAEYGLTPDQLFGASGQGRKSAAKKTQAKGKGKAKAPKFADGAGNTWGGMGKRPDWVRQALDAGKALEDFLIGKPAKAAPVKRAASKKPSTKPVPARKPVTAAPKKATPVATKKKVAPAKKVAAKKVAAPKRRQTKAASSATESAAS